MKWFSNVQFKLYFLCDIFPDHRLYSDLSSTEHIKDTTSELLCHDSHYLNCLYCFCILYYFNECFSYPVKILYNAQCIQLPPVVNISQLFFRELPSVQFKPLGRTVYVLPIQGQPVAKYILTQSMKN